ncbi:MAG TPA: glucoamylase family protein, partial [Kofleriaceae bacterium]
MLITRRRLLEWRTAADATRAARTSLLGTYASMGVLPLATTAVAVALAWQRSPMLWLAAPVLVLWLLAPAIAFWLSAPLRPAKPRLGENDIAFLRGVARRTWRFFETAVSAEDHDLPPDNVQEHPPVGVAHRTSPTNIGCALVANLAAYDLGYATTGDVIARTTRTFATLDRLPRYHGHFYNWYDTRSLEPLRPMYVSTVDSGNLTGLLLTLAAGLDALAGDPLVRPELCAGLRDTLDVLCELAQPPLEVARVRELLLQTPPTTPSGLHRLLVSLTSATSELARTVEARKQRELTAWAHALQAQVRQALADLDHLAPWLELLAAPERGQAGELLTLLDVARSLGETAQLDTVALPAIDRALAATAEELGSSPGGARAWLGALRTAVTTAADRASLRITELRQLAVRCGELGDHDVELLYDRSRHLLAIGYNVVDHRLDAGFYDLLASEARLASYVAIAQGKLPQEHWFHLGRQLTTAGGRPALLSWSGSMFEYLMPLMVMPSYPGTLLDTTYRAVVERQIEYGRERGTPWGISESGYDKVDTHLNYQYRAFGVPGLGFKRGLAEDHVIAPYASVMALMVAPEAACANLRRLSSEGRLGGHGFYEAVDYTPSRLPPGKDSVTIQSYMAHHQGMALLSLVYLLADRPMQRRFAADPALRATDLLLQERVPRAPTIVPHPAELSAVRITDAVERELRVFTTPNTPAPEVGLLSNGRYHVAITNAGGGYSRFHDLAVTRWHEDPTRDAWGSFCYLRDVASGSFWSAAHQPTLRPAKRYEAIFSPGRAEFRRSDEQLETHVEISVSPEDDIELRQISITNLGKARRTIELTSYAEVVLATQAADAAHPAFSNLFVQTELVRQHQAILCTRRPRSAGEQPPWMLHLMVVHGPLAAATSFETARAEFIGRGRSSLDPVAMHRSTLGDSEGSVLDPIVAIRNTVEIGVDETVRVHLVTGIAETRAGAIALIEKYTDRHLAARVFELSWTQSQVLQRRLDVTSTQTQLYDGLASKILYSNAALRAQRSVIARNRSSQSGLWAYGISGDLPIVLVRVADAEHIDLVRDLVRAHAYWQLHGLSVDLVVWNEDPSGYRQNLQDAVMALIST